MSLREFEEMTQEILALPEVALINIATCKELGWSTLNSL